MNALNWTSTSVRTPLLRIHLSETPRLRPPPSHPAHTGKTLMLDPFWIRSSTRKPLRRRRTRDPGAAADAHPVPLTARGVRGELASRRRNSLHGHEGRRAEVQRHRHPTLWEGGGGVRTKSTGLHLPGSRNGITASLRQSGRTPLARFMEQACAGSLRGWSSTPTAASRSPHSVTVNRHLRQRAAITGRPRQS